MHWILIVDEDTQTRRALIDGLLEVGVGAACATSAGEALRLLAAARDLPIAVVSDLHLRSGAIALLDNLHRDARFRHIPSFIFTASESVPHSRATFVFKKDAELKRLVAVIDSRARQLQAEPPRAIA